MSLNHIPVLLNEVLQLLPEKGLVVDGTLGGGGHAEAILLANSKLRLIGLDRDPKAPGREMAKVEKYKGRFKFINSSYADLLTAIAKSEQAAIKFVLLDLGFSSIQIADANRGLAFSKHGPLDMRYNQDDLSLRTAADIINTASRHELEHILLTYGEERQAKKIVSHLLEHRKKESIRTTTQLRDFIATILPAPKRKSIHPATKTFQALRIAVNKELDELVYFLKQVVPSLPKGSTVAVISFHSLEDRPVKQVFKELATPHLGKSACLQLLTKKPITPTEEEIRQNVRSRSAKMRVAVRI